VDEGLHSAQYTGPSLAVKHTEMPNTFNTYNIYSFFHSFYIKHNLVYRHVSELHSLLHCCCSHEQIKLWNQELLDSVHLLGVKRFLVPCLLRLSSDRQHLSCNVWLEVRAEIIRSVLCWNHRLTHIDNLDAVSPVHVVWNHVDTDKLTTANGGTFTSRSVSLSNQSR